MRILSTEEGDIVSAILGLDRKEVSKNRWFEGESSFGEEGRVPGDDCIVGGAEGKQRQEDGDQESDRFHWRFDYWLNPLQNDMLVYGVIVIKLYHFKYILCKEKNNNW